MAELIVALDVATAEAADLALSRLGGSVDFCKLGLELFTACGPDIVRRVAARGQRVFLDLKLHDIPHTVERSVAAAAALGVELLTVHASGGRAMIAAAAAAARASGDRRPRILAVTALTSLEQSDLADLGIQRPLEQHVAALACMAVEAGADGLVCSPREVGLLHGLLPDALLVTPGIRPGGAALGDQKRVATPAAAVRDGATHLVVGRPILDAADPAAAARAILREMRA